VTFVYVLIGGALLSGVFHRSCRFGKHKRPACAAAMSAGNITFSISYDASASCVCVFGREAGLNQQAKYRKIW
jgi:hypothetical protein